MLAEKSAIPVVLAVLDGALQEVLKRIGGTTRENAKAGCHRSVSILRGIWLWRREVARVYMLGGFSSESGLAYTVVVSLDPRKYNYWLAEDIHTEARSITASVDMSWGTIDVEFVPFKNDRRGGFKGYRPVLLSFTA